MLFGYIINQPLIFCLSCFSIISDDLSDEVRLGVETLPAKDVTIGKPQITVPTTLLLETEIGTSGECPNAVFCATKGLRMLEKIVGVLIALICRETSPPL